MSEQIFMQAPAAVPDGMAQHSTHKAFSMVDADDPSAYKFNHVQGDGVRGTLVPVPTGNGGIRGSDNPFGKIVMGTETKMIDGRLQEVPFTPTWLGDAVKKKRGAQPMAPPPPPTPMPDPQTQGADTLSFPDLLGGDEMAAKQAADEAVREQAMQYKEQARQAVAQQAEAEHELSDILSAMNSPSAPQDPVPQQTIQQPQVQQPQPPAQPSPGMPNAQDMNQFMQMMSIYQGMQQQASSQEPDPDPSAPLPTPPADGSLGYDPTEVDPVLVKLSGQFGTSRGKYKFVHRTDDFIVLVYDEDANIFTPPASDVTFKLSCNGEEHEVYFGGVEFELPFYRTGVQVMIRS